MLTTLFVAACDPEATPLPVDIAPTSAPTAVSAAVQPIRYAIEATTQALIPAADYAEIIAAAEIQTVSAPLVETDLGLQYDIVVALGDLPNSSTASPLTIALALNTALPPLNDTTLADIVQRRIDTEGLAAALGIPGAVGLPHTSETSQALRTSLANLGLPDGFDLALGIKSVPGAEALTTQLASINIDVGLSLISGDDPAELERFHLILFNRAADTLPPNIAPENVIDLYTLPISYRAVPELTVEFTADGFPLPHR